MRLSAFIESAREQIIAESVQYATTLPQLGNQAVSVLRDHLPLVLDVAERRVTFTIALPKAAGAP